MRLTIRARVAIGTFVLLAGVLGLAAALIEEEVRESTLKTFDARLRAEGEALASLTRFDGKRVELEFQDETMTTFAPKAAAYFEVFWEKGSVERSRSLGGEHLPPPDAAIFGGRGRQSHKSTIQGPFGGPVRMFTLAISRSAGEGSENEEEEERGPRTTIVVEVARPLAELERTRRPVHAALALALPVALVLGTLGAFAVAWRATAPVARLAAEASEIGVARLDKRLDARNVAGELESLAHTLNDAFDRLAAGVARERAFSADVAHELRTPLAIARSTLELALSRERSTEEYRESLSETFEAVTRLEKIVSALMVLARAEAGGVEKERVDLRAVARAALDAARPVAEQAQVPLRLELPPQEVLVQGHAALLERLLVNLIENGVRHGGSPQGVDVVVGEDAKIAVLDRGSGLPEDFLRRAFDRFARADESRARESGGAGLGLAIARAIARAHGGDVTAGPRQGGGAELVLTLPRA